MGKNRLLNKEYAASGRNLWMSEVRFVKMVG